jgi:hypothetical protein
VLRYRATLNASTWLLQTLLELLTRPSTFYLLYGESAHFICIAILYSNVFFVVGRCAVTALLTIRLYVARLSACYTMISFGCITLHNEKMFWRWSVTLALSFACMLTSTDSTKQPDHSRIPFRDAYGMIESSFVKQFLAQLNMLRVL